MGRVKDPAVKERGVRTYVLGENIYGYNGVGEREKERHVWDVTEEDRRVGWKEQGDLSNKPTLLRYASRVYPQVVGVTTPGFPSRLLHLHLIPSTDRLNFSDLTLSSLLPPATLRCFAIRNDIVRVPH